MSEQLVVRLGSTLEDKLHWLVWSDSDQEIIASGTLDNADSLSTLQQRAAHRAITLLVPSSDVLLKKVTLPSKASRKALAAIPFMLEDELSSDIDNLFFAAGPKQGDQQAVAIVSHDKIQQWQQMVTDAGMQCEKMLPDVLALPDNENSWSLLSLGDDLLVKQDKWQGLQGESLWVLPAIEHMAKQQTQPVHLTLYSELNLPGNLANIELEQAPADMAMQILAKGALQHKFNLLQGDYKVRKQSNQQWKKWRVAAVLGAIALTTSLIDKGVEAHLLNQQQAELQAQIAKEYQRGFPNGGHYRNIKSKITDLMQKLQQGGGGVSMLAMLSQLSDAFAASELHPQAMRFNQNRSELRIQAEAKNFNAIEQFKAKAEAAGFVVEQGAINNNGSSVVSSLVIRS